MEYRKLGQTGLEASVIGFGAEWIGKMEQAEVNAMACLLYTSARAFFSASSWEKCTMYMGASSARRPSSTVASRVSKV